MTFDWEQDLERYRLLGDLVLVKVDADERFDGSMIYKPASMQARNEDPGRLTAFEMTGRVLKVGPGKKTGHGRLPMNVQAGDAIVFNAWVGLEPQGGEGLRAMHESEITGILISPPAEPA